MIMFSQFLSGISIHGDVDYRQFAADTLQGRLDELGALEKRIHEARQEFAQLAIASRLRSEFSYDVCESDKRKPVTFRIKWHPLSNGGLLIAELTNQLTSAAFIEWTALIQIWPLIAIDTTGRGKERRNISSRTYLKALPRLDAGATVAFEIYCKEDSAIDVSMATRPCLVRCHLARHFKNGTTGMDGNMLTFCIGTTVVAANDLVFDRSTAAFAMNAQKSINQGFEMDRGEFRFCITKSLLQLMFPDTFSTDRRLMEWLFPQAQSWDRPSSNATANSAFRSPMLTLSTNALVQCTMQDRAKTDDVLITMELTAFACDVTELLASLKVAIWIKMMLAIRTLRRYPTRVTLDWNPSGIVDGYIDENELGDHVTSKLPFA